MSADLTIKQGDLQPEVRAALTDDAGAAVDLTGATVTFHMINSADEQMGLDAPATVESPASGGIVSYQWQSADTAAPGVYLAWWVVSWPDGDQSFPADGYDSIEIEGTEVLESWATTRDVRKITGEDVDARTVLIAQGVIETYINRVWRTTDLAGRDGIWLKRAVAYQSSYVAANPDLYTGPSGVQSIKQGDNTVVYASGRGRADGSELVAPLAKLACARLRRASGTVRLNSMFQAPERRLPGWRSR
jgi:hypothetical protein